ncbi:DUF1345 domain-containing protein [Rhizobium sp. BK602]|uniref:DUF1345 domain-containing protein n=1 Tax=Rhizobium sp. BK602 TaxID=2586986 RepID=UPI00160C6483|nr:DUF1345 domain-containing protein [Rhizobium sp. BK602]MBB3612735.1 putative membrane protein [Rhizobium sp. BK602]
MTIGNRIAPIRFLVFAAVFLLAGAIAAILHADWTIALLSGFDIATCVFIVSTFPLLDDSPEEIREAAKRNDANRAGLLAITVLLCLIVLIAIAALIARPTTPQWTEVSLIVLTLILSWLFANTVFAMHYTHLFYSPDQGRDLGGLEVPNTSEPSYWDMFYFSFTLGMTFQTSDVTITGSHMRKVVLFHCMAAFIFNMGVLAFTINALGSL